MNELEKDNINIILLCSFIILQLETPKKNINVMKKEIIQIEKK